MKIRKNNAGVLTNFEVLEFLHSRGASKDPTRVMKPIAASEFQVYDYLIESAACNQTRDHIGLFMEKIKPYNLAKAEILNIINIRPSTAPQIYPILEDVEVRQLEEKLEDMAEMIVEVLPPSPGEINTDNNAEEEANNEANANEVEEEQQMIK